MRTGFMLWGLLLWERDEGPFAWPHSIGAGNLLDEETAGEDGVHVVGFVVMGAG